MNMLINASTNQPVTMSSLELVEFINSQRKADEAVLRHDSFMAKVPKVLGEKDAQKFLDIYSDAYGRQQRCYVFPKREACLMAMSYSYDLQAVVYDRMTALEAKQTPVLDLSNPEHLRNALLGYTEKVIALEHQVEELTPKAAALDRISDCTGLFGVREAAKSLKVRQSDLTTLLVNRGWAYRDRRDVLQPSAEKTARGYVTAVMSKPIRQTDGEERVFSQLRITTKGVARLAQILAKGVAA